MRSGAYSKSPGVITGARMILVSGTQLGPYEITAPLGTGGMGEVYCARDTRLERTVAIKNLPSHLSSDLALLSSARKNIDGGPSSNHFKWFAIRATCRPVPPFGTVGNVCLSLRRGLGWAKDSGSSAYQRWRKQSVHHGVGQLGRKTEAITRQLSVLFSRGEISCAKPAHPRNVLPNFPI